MQIKTRSRIIVFVFAFLTWVALTGIHWQEVMAGFLFAIIITFIAGQFLITTEKKAHILRRLYYLIIYLFTFLWEMIKANIHVAYLVLHPLCPIKPGIVRINTKLTKDSAITLLCNSITLTPGTMTVDVNRSGGQVYIHWIDVKTINDEESTKQISGVFEKILKEIFE